MEMTDRSKWTVKDYRRALAAHGARTSRCKSDLEERLCHYESNDGFRGPVVDLPGLNPMLKFPATAAFHSLTMSDEGAVPKLTHLHVEEYASYCQVKSTNLESLATFFLTGIVSVEMKKVTCSLKFVIDMELVEVRNAHCECAQGCGPAAACKHVLGTLLMLVHFVKTGKLKIQLSCTEQLQSFKKLTRGHGGSLVQAEKLRECT